MLSKENIEQLKKEGYSLKDIENIIKGLDDLESGNTLGEDEFWSSVYEEINNSLREKECII